MSQHTQITKENSPAHLEQTMSRRTTLTPMWTQERNQTTVICRFGAPVNSYKRPGLKGFVFPILHSTYNVDTTTRQMGAMIQNVQTSNNQFVDMPILVKFKVADAAKFIFESPDPLTQIMNDILKAIQHECANTSFDQLFKDRSEINTKIHAIAQEKADVYGIQIVELVDQPPIADAKTVTTSNDRVAAENERVAKVTRAKGDREAAVEAAEAEKQTRRLKGEGVAEYNNSVFSQYGARMGSLIEKGLTPLEAAGKMVELIAIEGFVSAAEHGKITLISGSPAVNFKGAVEGASGLTDEAKAALLADLLSAYNAQQGGAAPVARAPA